MRGHLEITSLLNARKHRRSRIGSYSFQIGARVEKCFEQRPVGFQPRLGLSRNPLKLSESKHTQTLGRMRSIDSEQVVQRPDLLRQPWFSNNPSATQSTQAESFS